MEYLAIVFILEIFAVIATFVGNNSTMEAKIIMFVLIGGLGVLILSMRIHDFFIAYVLKKKSFRRAIRMYKSKLRMTPNSRSKNGILINIAPLHFMLDEMEEGKKVLDSIDLLTIKLKVLKGYMQLLYAYYYYKIDDVKKADGFLEAAINYDELFKFPADLVKSAILLKDNKKDEAAKLFSGIPKDLDDYIEPFDKLFLEVESQLK